MIHSLINFERCRKFAVINDTKGCYEWTVRKSVKIKKNKIFTSNFFIFFFTLSFLFITIFFSLKNTKLYIFITIFYTNLKMYDIILKVLRSFGARNDIRQDIDRLLE